MRRALFLDRDGVLNHASVIEGKPFAPTLLANFHFLPGVKDALLLAKNAGFMNIVVTNQPDFSTGKIEPEQFRLIQERCFLELIIDDLKYCPHVETDHCDCRKPLPGMIMKAAKEHSIDVTKSYMIGDRWRDIECGQAAGCKTNFYIDYGYSEKKPEPPYTLVSNLGEAVQIILEETQLLILRERI
jgi:D-glycero-D-manno-heptose 1,7-bisphosphate phosphatase